MAKPEFPHKAIDPAVVFPQSSPHSPVGDRFLTLQLSSTWLSCCFFQKQCCHFTFCISISSMTELSSHATQVTNCAIPKVSLLLLCGKFDRDSSLKGWTSHFLMFNFQIQAHLSLLSSEVHLLFPILLLLLLLIEIPLPLGRWRWSSHAQAPEGPRPVLKKIRMTILLLLMLMTFKLWGWVHIKSSWGVQMSPI